jgi:hypothetical protein
MSDVDRMIEEALRKEESELLARIGEEPGFFGMVSGLFSGRLGWVNMIMIVTQTLAFVAGAWAAWMFFAADDVVTQLRWGLPSAVLLIMSLIIKMSVWPEVHANRLMRELERIELQIVRSRPG